MGHACASYAVRAMLFNYAALPSCITCACMAPLTTPIQISLFITTSAGAIPCIPYVTRHLHSRHQSTVLVAIAHKSIRAHHTRAHTPYMPS